MKRWRVAGLCFEHMHMGDNLKMVAEHPDAEIAGVCDVDRARMERDILDLGVPEDRVFSDYRQCLEETRPDFVILCPATGRHAEWTERVAAYGLPVLVEKPFAASLTEADRMIAAMARAGVPLAINWPLRWYPCHITAQRWVAEGRIGRLQEVHYYDGNRGPLHHLAHKVETDPEFVAREKAHSWWYQRAEGGGSLLDYLGYGATLATWFHGGAAPLEVTCAVDGPAGLEVDEHSVTVARYATGLSTFQTRWGTFTDPWTHQPQPKCGFVLKGSAGTISSYDYESTIRVQTPEFPEGRDIPVDEVRAPGRNPVEYFIHCLATGTPVDGPLAPAVSRIGQQIVDAAVRSAAEKRTVPLPGLEERTRGRQRP